MPELNVIPYDENKGEWFPYQGEENDNTRSRAMYFFHNSLGEVASNVQIGFSDQITTGGGGSSTSWTGPADDIQSWPIKDLETGEPIENYSNNSAGEASSCYKYRIQSGQDGVGLPFRFRIVVWKPNNDTPEDLAIYNRYLNALKFMFSSDNTSLEITRVDDLSGNNYEPSEELVGALPMADVVDLPSVERIDNAGAAPRANNDWAIDDRESGNNDGFVALARRLQEVDGLMRLPALESRIDWEVTDSVGTIDWNAVASQTQGSGTTTINGFFMIDPNSDLGYQIGDYLLLEAADEENEFHNRVVFVNEVRTINDGTIAYEIQLLDDIGFFDEAPENFTITKLTNAPKLKIKYRIPDVGSNDEAITIVDDQGDVN